MRAVSSELYIGVVSPGRAGSEPQTRDRRLGSRDRRGPDAGRLPGQARDPAQPGARTGEGRRAKDRLIAAIRWDDLWTFNPAFWNAPGRLDGFYAEASK